MGYSFDRFLKPLQETDKVIRVFDTNNVPTYTINPFSVLRAYITNLNLNIVLTGKKTIILDFPTDSETKDALVKFQHYVDVLRQKTPQVVDTLTEKYVENIITNAVGVTTINGLTASSQVLDINVGDNIEADVVSRGSTHSLTIGLTGLIPMKHGGLNNDNFTNGELLYSNGDKVESSGYKVDDSGSSDKDIWSAAKIIESISTMSHKAVFNIGDGSTDQFSLNHNLGTRAVIVQIFDNQTGETVETDVVRKTDNSVEVNFNRPPDNDEYCVVIT